jgi:diguanylate cyclase (GGDEF)-like protein
VLASVVREMDTIGRLGADQFVALLMGSAEPDSRLIIERFRAALAARNEHERRGYEICCSMGMTAYDPGRHVTVQALLGEADSAMLQQKLASRRRNL